MGRYRYLERNSQTEIVGKLLRNPANTRKREVSRQLEFSAFHRKLECIMLKIQG
jgi:phage replication-related protein YjqB (UPF0714/DUF867 family)